MIDPVSVIVSSLAFYAAQKLGDKIIDKTGDDLYESVKDKLFSVFDSNDDVMDAVAKVEAKPEVDTRRSYLRGELSGAEITQNDEVVARAEIRSAS